MYFSSPPITFIYANVKNNLKDISSKITKKQFFYQSLHEKCFLNINLHSYWLQQTLIVSLLMTTYAFQNKIAFNNGIFIFHIYCIQPFILKSNHFPLDILIHFVVNKLLSYSKKIHQSSFITFFNKLVYYVCKCKEQIISVQGKCCMFQIFTYLLPQAGFSPGTYLLTWGNGNCL